MANRPLRRDVKVRISPYRQALLVGLALVCGYLVLSNGAANAANRIPAAYAATSYLADKNSEVLTLKARGLLVESVTGHQSRGQQSGSLLPTDSAKLQEAGHAAREALLGDITQVEALAILGAAAHARGDVSRAGAIMRASDSLSKRNLLTRLWLIEEAAKRERLPEVLKHIDVALRVSALAQDQMFPLLARALTEDRMVADFVRVLRADPPWAEAFIYTAATSGLATKNLAEVYLQLDGTFARDRQELPALLMEQLIAQRAYAEAFAFERKLTGATSRDCDVTDPKFAEHEGLEPLTWLLTSSANFDAARSADPFGKTGLDLLSSGSGAEVVARQLLNLKPGRYRFANSYTSDSGEPKLVLEWRLRCAETDDLIGRYQVMRNGSAIWSVPAACEFQWLELRADAGGTVSSERVFVRPIKMKRLDPAF